MNLKDYMKKNELSIRKFQAISGLNPLTIRAAQRGDSISLLTAFKIFSITRGLVTMKEMGYQEKKDGTWDKIPKVET